MSRWDPPPPSRLQRWIARHAVALQMISACFALGSLVLFLTMLGSGGSGSSYIAPILNVVVWFSLIWVPPGIARYVADYDRHQQTGRH